MHQLWKPVAQLENLVPGLKLGVNGNKFCTFAVMTGTIRCQHYLLGAMLQAEEGKERNSGKEIMVDGAGLGSLELKLC